MEFDYLLLRVNAGCEDGGSKGGFMTMRSYRFMEANIQQWIFQQTHAQERVQQDTMQPYRFQDFNSPNPAVIWYNLAILGLASPML